MGPVVILSARYALQLFFGFLGRFSAPYVNVFVQENFLLLFLKKGSNTIKLLQMLTKKSNPQNFRKHSCPKVASDLVFFEKKIALMGTLD